ncbi:hypothetical protein BC831DRAFT_454046 [Entophlyctis helioformis]|nr:hypothetical protein BC831DRAFT_454046 [Entophlyctis helioformis]
MARRAGGAGAATAATATTTAAAAGPIIKETTLTQRTGPLGISTRRHVMLCYAQSQPLADIAAIQARILARYSSAANAAHQGGASPSSAAAASASASAGANRNSSSQSRSGGRWPAHGACAGIAPAAGNPHPGTVAVVCQPPVVVAVAVAESATRKPAAGAPPGRRRLAQHGRPARPGVRHAGRAAGRRLPGHHGRRRAAPTQPAAADCAPVAGSGARLGRGHWQSLPSRAGLGARHRHGHVGAHADAPLCLAPGPGCCCCCCVPALAARVVCFVVWCVGRWRCFVAVVGAIVVVGGWPGHPADHGLVRRLPVVVRPAVDAPAAGPRGACPVRPCPAQCEPCHGPAPRRRVVRVVSAAAPAAASRDCCWAVACVWLVWIGACNQHRLAVLAAVIRFWHLIWHRARPRQPRAPFNSAVPHHLIDGHRHPQKPPLGSGSEPAAAAAAATAATTAATAAATPRPVSNPRAASNGAAVARVSAPLADTRAPKASYTCPANSAHSDQQHKQQTTGQTRQCTAGVHVDSAASHAGSVQRGLDAAATHERDAAVKVCAGNTPAAHDAAHLAVAPQPAGGLVVCEHQRPRRQPSAHRSQCPAQRLWSPSRCSRRVVCPRAVAQFERAAGRQRVGSRSVHDAHMDPSSLCDEHLKMYNEYQHQQHQHDHGSGIVDDISHTGGFDAPPVAISTPTRNGVPYRDAQGGPDVITASSIAASEGQRRLRRVGIASFGSARQGLFQEPSDDGLASQPHITEPASPRTASTAQIPIAQRASQETPPLPSAMAPHIDEPSSPRRTHWSPTGIPILVRWRNKVKQIAADDEPVQQETDEIQRAIANTNINEYASSGYRNRTISSNSNSSSDGHKTVRAEPVISVTSSTARSAGSTTLPAPAVAAASSSTWDQADDEEETPAPRTPKRRSFLGFLTPADRSTSAKSLSPKRRSSSETVRPTITKGRSLSQLLSFSRPGSSSSSTQLAVPDDDQPPRPKTPILPVDPWYLKTRPHSSWTTPLPRPETDALGGHDAGDGAHDGVPLGVQQAADDDADDTVSAVSENIMVWSKEQAQWTKIPRNTPALGR